MYVNKTHCQKIKKRKIISYNPPFNLEVSINLAKDFLDNIVFHIAYINRRKSAFTQSPTKPSTSEAYHVSSRKSRLSRIVVHRAIVTTSDDITWQYTGMTANDFKGVTPSIFTRSNPGADTTLLLCLVFSGNSVTSETKHPASSKLLLTEHYHIHVAPLMSALPPQKTGYLPKTCCILKK